MAMRWNLRMVSRWDKLITDFPSPDDSSECRGWEPQVAYYAMCRTVIVVANTRVEGRWKAYIDSVAGIDHETEWQDVRRHGVTIPQPVARAMFPGFADIPYAN